MGQSKRGAGQRQGSVRNCAHNIVLRFVVGIAGQCVVALTFHGRLPKKLSAAGLDYVHDQRPHAAGLGVEEQLDIPGRAGGCTSVRRHYGVQGSGGEARMWTEQRRQRTKARDTYPLPRDSGTKYA